MWNFSIYFNHFYSFFTLNSKCLSWCLSTYFLIILFFFWIISLIFISSYKSSICSQQKIWKLQKKKCKGKKKLWENILFKEKHLHHLWNILFLISLPDNYQFLIFANSKMTNCIFCFWFVISDCVVWCCSWGLFSLFFGIRVWTQHFALAIEIHGVDFIFVSSDLPMLSLVVSSFIW